MVQVVSVGVQQAGATIALAGLGGVEVLARCRTSFELLRRIRRRVIVFVGHQVSVAPFQSVPALEVSRAAPTMTASQSITIPTRGTRFPVLIREGASEPIAGVRGRAIDEVLMGLLAREDLQINTLIVDLIVDLVQLLLALFLDSDDCVGNRGLLSGRSGEIQIVVVLGLGALVQRPVEVVVQVAFD